MACGGVAKKANFRGGRSDACEVHPVLAVLEARRVAGPAGTDGVHKDDFTVGLLVEGGARRGAVSAGMTSALQELGFDGCFDHVYGLSAGAINAAYLLAGQAELCVHSYWDELSSREFASFRRAARRQPIVSTEFVLRAMATSRKLDWEAVLARRTQLHVLATSARTLELVDVAALTAELPRAIGAAISMPFLSGPLPQIDGVPYLDASTCYALPYRLALADGCTHLLVLRTRPAGELVRNPIRARILKLTLDRIHPQLQRRRLRRAALYRAEAGELARLQLARDEQLEVCSVFPQTAMKTMEPNKQLVYESALQGFRAVYAIFGEKLPSVLPFRAPQR